jgi:hypothetical protein
MNASKQVPSPGRTIWIFAASLLTIAEILGWLRVVPLNTAILNWNANVPPSNWALTRDAWRHWSLIRVILAGAAVILFIVSNAMQTPVENRIPKNER